MSTVARAWAAYCNGHGWLARKLRRAGIGFTLADNAFVKVSDLESAQQLADRLSPNELHRRLDHYARNPMKSVPTYHASTRSRATGSGAAGAV